MDQPMTGGRWVRDPESGALSKVNETAPPTEPAAEAEAVSTAGKATTVKKGRE